MSAADELPAVRRGYGQLTVARELLRAELVRLLADHFDDNPDAGCADCQRAARVRWELSTIERLILVRP